MISKQDLKENTGGAYGECNDLTENLDNLHTTEQGARRIKKNLKLQTDGVVDWCKKKIENADSMNPIPLGKYRHYKGNQYEVVGFARNSETLVNLVVYEALYGKRELWVHPLSIWDNVIEVDRKTVKRFEYIGESEDE